MSLCTITVKEWHKPLVYYIFLNNFCLQNMARLKHPDIFLVKLKQHLIQYKHSVIFVLLMEKTQNAISLIDIEVHLCQFVKSSSCKNKL